MKKNTFTKKTKGVSTTNIRNSGLERPQFFKILFLWLTLSISDIVFPKILVVINSQNNTCGAGKISILLE